MEITTEQNAELGLTGKGVAPVRIEEIDKLVEKYIRRKEISAKADAAESEAKAELVDAMHEHADQLEQPDGDLIYRFNQTIVSLIAGAEKLKIESKT
jgi:rare lipoprotein A (peptidoglycan hydrolase)